MPKQPVSVTLERDNLLWLRGRMAGRKRRSLSDALDEVISGVRLAGNATGEIRSVVGTIDLAADDPLLEKADSYLTGEFERSLARPGLTGRSSAVTRRGRSGRVTAAKRT